MIDAPAAAAAPPPANPNIAPFNSRTHDRLCRGGLWLGVLSAALCLVAGFGDRVLAKQGTDEVTAPAGVFTTLGIMFILLFGLAIFLPYAWARITGIGLLGAAGFSYAIAVGVARTSEDLVVGPEIRPGQSGTMMVLAFVAACAGLAFALVGAPRIGRPPRLNAAGEPMPGQSGYAVAALVLSLCGTIVGFTAPLGIAFAVAAFDDIARSSGTRGGRGMAVAGLVIGIVLVALSVLLMVGFIAAADPSFNER